MDKIIYAGDQDPLLAALDGQLSTYFESGRQVKSAASSSFSRKMMEAHMPDDNHFAVHYIAIGAGEPFGPNKNGDHWPEAGLKNASGDFGMHTFMRGHYFREHRNRDPKEAIGSIRAAAYNPEMKRGEVLVWGDKKKAAKEYERAKSGKTLTGSMSARVPGDRCSCCNNFAKSAKHYCVHLKEHMLQWMPAFSKFAYAINDKPNFFDWSDVENRADRIALQLEVMFGKSDEQAVKQASALNAGGFMFSELQAKAAGIMLPDSVSGCLSPVRQRILDRFCEEEEYIEAVHTKSASVAKDDKYEFLTQAATHAFDLSVGDEDQLEAMRKIEPGVLFGYLAKQATVLPPRMFFAYATRQSLKQAAADPALAHFENTMTSRLFRELRAGQADREMEAMFDVASNAKISAYPMEENAEFLLQPLVNAYNIKPASLRYRALLNCADEKPTGLEKSASTVSEADVAKSKIVAKAYAFYKIAFTDAVTEALGQDYIDGAAVLMISSQHNY